MNVAQITCIQNPCAPGLERQISALTNESSVNSSYDLSPRMVQQIAQMRGHGVRQLITRINAVEGSFIGVLDGSWGDYEKQIAAGIVLSELLTNHVPSKHQINRLGYMLFANLEGLDGNRRVPPYLREHHAAMVRALTEAYAKIIYKGGLAIDDVLDLYRHKTGGSIIQESVRAYLARHARQLPVGELNILSRENPDQSLSQAATAALKYKLTHRVNFSTMPDAVLADISDNHPVEQLKSAANKILCRRFSSPYRRVKDDVVQRLSEGHSDVSLENVATNTLIKRLNKGRYSRHTAEIIAHNHPKPQVRKVATDVVNVVVAHQKNNK